MGLQKRWQIGILVFLFLCGTNSYLAQSPRIIDAENSSKSIGNYFTFNDSVKTAATIYNNMAAYKAVKTGLISGLIGTAVGFGVAYILTDKQACDMGCAITYTMIPLVAGVISFIAGTTISYTVNYDERNNFENFPHPNRPFNQIGINFIVAGPISDGPQNGGVSLGTSYRNLNTKFYLPNKLSVIYGNSESAYYLYKFDGYPQIYSNDHRISIEGVHVNYNSIFSFLYGVEVGIVFSDAYTPEIQDDFYIEVPYKNTITPFIDFIAGFNLNLFSWLSSEISYKYEPYGPYNSLKPPNAQLYSNTHKLSFSLSTYF